MTYDLDALKLHLAHLVEWRTKHPRPNNRKRKHLNRWRQNRAYIKEYESLISYIETLGPDWFVVGEPRVLTFYGNDGDEDDFFVTIQDVELNRNSHPLPRGTLRGSDCCLCFQGIVYYISKQKQWRSFPTTEALAKAVLDKVVEQYGPSPA